VKNAIVIVMATVNCSAIEMNYSRINQWEPNLFVLPQKRLVRWSVVLNILGKLWQQMKHKNEETQTHY
jgi:hypothetical protein